MYSTDGQREPSNNPNAASSPSAPSAPSVSVTMNAPLLRPPATAPGSGSAPVYGTAIANPYQPQMIVVPQQQPQGPPGQYPYAVGQPQVFGIPPPQYGGAMPQPYGMVPQQHPGMMPQQPQYPPQGMQQPVAYGGYQQGQMMPNGYGQLPQSPAGNGIEGDGAPVDAMNSTEGTAGKQTGNTICYRIILRVDALTGCLSVFWFDDGDE